MSILLKGARVIDPESKTDAVLDILIEGDKISKVASKIDLSAEKRIEAAGKIIAPGLIDMHVHLREPGREDKETVASATRAAAKGGVTTLLAMPNTNPAMDCQQNINLLKEIIAKDALINVLICGTITKGRQGGQLSDIGSLKAAGAVAISDDGASVDDQAIMYQAFLDAKKAGILTVCHCEDKKLSGKGVINLGFNATRLGLKGISNESEYRRVERDIELAQKASARLHIAHVSCAESVEAISRAKQKGLAVSAETCPHYFSFTDEALLGYDTNLKINPPLRTDKDIRAIKQGLKEGVIDVISSDHAPHTENEKDIEFERAEFGVVGLETGLSAGVSELLEKGTLDWPGLIEKLSLNPARILGLPTGRLKEGSPADVIIISQEASWTVAKENLVSKSKNSAFMGRSLKGLIDYTICNGKIIYQR